MDLCFLLQVSPHEHPVWTIPVDDGWVTPFLQAHILELLWSQEFRLCWHWDLPRRAACPKPGLLQWLQEVVVWWKVGVGHWCCLHWGVKRHHKPAWQRMWNRLRDAKACPVFPCIVSCPADPDQGHSQGFACFHQPPTLERAWAGNIGTIHREHTGSLHGGSQGFSCSVQAFQFICLLHSGALTYSLIQLCTICS